MAADLQPVPDRKPVDRYLFASDRLLDIRLDLAQARCASAAEVGCHGAIP
jgi:hypothetical protein